MNTTGVQKIQQAYERIQQTYERIQQAYGRIQQAYFRFRKKGMILRIRLIFCMRQLKKYSNQKVASTLNK
jgi:hypothetical protein